MAKENKEEMVRIGLSHCYLGIVTEYDIDNEPYDKIVMTHESMGGISRIDSGQPIFPEQAQELIKLLSRYL